MGTENYIRISGTVYGTQLLELNNKMLKALESCPVPQLSEKLRKALKIAKQHGVGLLVDLDVSTGVLNYAPTGRPGETIVCKDEAIVLAAELNHIFGNNPNFYRWPIKLGRGCTVYSFRSLKGASAEFVTLVLGSDGQYKTSYDPTRNEFFPPVSRLSTKPLAKIYPQILDELTNMYKKVRGNIEEMRSEESDNNAKEGSDSVVISK